jgi:DNA-binding beta-propeller fold protein YncE
MPKIQRLAIFILCLASSVSAHCTEPARLIDRITVPGAPLKSFDIGFAGNGLYALADRSNASVDLFDTQHRRFIGRVGGFAGARDGDQSGPNGVVAVGAHQIWAGDGGSTVRIIDVASRRTIASVSTGGTKRVDEIAYDPRDNLVIAANNADQPPFITLISSRPPYTVESRITFPQATDGIEQSVWDAASGTVFVAIPEMGGTPSVGAVVQIDPQQGKILATNPVSKCMPGGLALGPGRQLLVACSDDAVKAGFRARSLLMDTRTGKVTTSFDQVGGSDEVWYDAHSGDYALAAVANPGGPVLGIIDAHDRRWLGNVRSGTAAHSVAADSGQFFVPVKAGDPGCESGCVEVFQR